MLTTTMNNKSHILATTVFLWFIPILIIMFCYYFIVQAVFKHEDELRQQAKKMNVTSLRSNSDQQAMSAEIRIAKISITNVALWLMAWTPFMAVSMVGTWGDSSQITALVCELPVILAKTSCAYNPMIYSLSHPKYREVLAIFISYMYSLVTDSQLRKYRCSRSCTPGCALWWIPKNLRILAIITLLKQKTMMLRMKIYFWLYKVEKLITDDDRRLTVDYETGPWKIIYS